VCVADTAAGVAQFEKGTPASIAMTRNGRPLSRWGAITRKRQFQRGDFSYFRLLHTHTLPIPLAAGLSSAAEQQIP
jgi:hypothetical protein